MQQPFTRGFVPADTSRGTYSWQCRRSGSRRFDPKLFHGEKHFGLLQGVVRKEVLVEQRGQVRVGG